VILLNEHGEVAECTTANIFCVNEGKVKTPPLSSGCLEGVTRSVLLEIAPRNGVPIVEQTLMPEDLYAANEVFITSTNRSLLGVSEIAGHKYEVTSGPMVHKLERAFDQVMREYVTQRTARLSS
jgi:branched-chain amino acid aminotransferase